MYCNNCGEEIREEELYCPVCGNKLEISNESTTNDVGICTGEKSKTLGGESFLDLGHIIKRIITVIHDWYYSNWKRVKTRKLKEEDLLHNVIWVEFHILIIIILCWFLLFLLIIGWKTNSYKYVNTAKTEQSFDDFLNGIEHTKKSLFNELEGTWANDEDTFSIAIEKDGVLRVADSTGAFGIDAFTYTEVDEDTIILKPAYDQNSDNKSIIGQIGDSLDLVSINMDYSVDGDILNVKVLGKSFSLRRIK